MAAPTTIISNCVSPMYTPMSPTSELGSVSSSASVSVSRSSSSSLSRSSSIYTFRSVSTSSSCTEYTSASCPSMFSSRTGSISSDSLTENETPPETPAHEHAYPGHDLDATPVFRNTKTMHFHSHSHSHPHNHSPVVDFSGRPILCALSKHSPHSPLQPGDNNYDCASPDAGYETECEENYPRRPRRKANPVDRTLRRRGERMCRPPPQQPHVSRDRMIPDAPRLGSSTHLMSPSTPTPTPILKREYRPRPTRITIPAPSPPLFPTENTTQKAVVGLGLGLGLPSSVALSPVRRAPNCVHRSSDDKITPSFRSIVPVTPQDLLLPLVPLPSPPPSKPTIAPLVSAVPDDSELSPLDLHASHTNNTRHPAFCFSHTHGGGGCKAGFCTAPYGVVTAAFLTMADHAQTQQVDVDVSQGCLMKDRAQLNIIPTKHHENESGKDVCPGDQARGIRRFESVNPYFVAVGFCVTSG